MKLLVRNFGAIKESVIDLSKRHYFFVGYNNTGKTYLAKLIYDIFNVETLSDYTESSRAIRSIENKSGSLLLTEETINTLLNSFATYLKEVTIPKSLKIGNDSSFILKDLEIQFQFDFQEDVEKPPLQSGAAIGFSNDEDTSANNRTIDIYTLKKAENSLEVKIENFTSEQIYEKLPKDFFENVPKKKFEEQINSIRDDVSKSFNQSLLSLLLQNREKPFFLPANRIFILENADELVEQDNARNAELAKSLLELLQSKDVDREKLGNIVSRKSDSNHTIQISNLISEISKLRKNKNEDFILNGTGLYDDLIYKLSSIMGGQIVMDRPSTLSNWVEKFKILKDNVQNEKPINMYLASSSINQLGILFLYFKYWAKADQNFLMIDEPEENLHPESQIKLINLLLEFASLNNRILITTHSPLLAEMINNYLVLGQLDNKEEVIENFNLIKVDMNPDNTGIYYFNGEVVTEHKVGNYGTIFSSFKQAQDKIYALGDVLNELMFKQLYKSEKNVSIKEY
ncbi:AAA family ATPase [Flectobacillus longus]|uniref:AAA family ATPase n=1 Tax=Flectobacillus longus TaxID=2984207 RepID=UPI0024B742B4|nr:AAA family ATPase [Flectobacillus longus]MDI9882690.1 AAA family ATPase [Flectobacillus longus]